MHKTLSRGLLLVAFLVGSAKYATAHTPYYLPNIFDVGDRGLVSLDATFGEELFIADYPIEETIFYIQTPDGSQVEPVSFTQLEARTVIEHTLEEDGTYRFSTGWYKMEPLKSYELNGNTRTLRDPNAELPEDAKLISYIQYKLMGETYVTKGAPDENSLSPLGVGLEFFPQTHPNEIFAGENFVVQLLLDGEPLSATEVELHLGQRQKQNSEPLYKTLTDNQGMATFMPEPGGIYMLRSQTLIPNGSDEAPDSSYIITMTLEIVD